MPININKRSDVNSVNGKVGDVMLNASDIGALSKDTKIPSKTSELINDSNYVADSDYKHTDNNYTTTDKNSVATIGNKVDKVEGKGLSTNDLTDELKADYDDAVLQAHTHNNKDILDNTTASYTTEERTKLSGIENNAQKNTVIGVKGEVETDYRVGNVNITKENIGLENVANERQWSETNHPTTISGYGITDSASSTDYNTLKGRVDTNEDNIAMLDSDVESLTTDVGMLETDMTTVKSAVTTIQDDYVPKTRKVNGKSLSADITLSASDVKAIPISQKGTSNGVAELDGNGLVPSSQLPSYVDDVLEYDTKTDFPTNGESGKIYIATDTNLQYRWTGTQYAEISSSLALGETSSTAYRGDRGKIAYDHSQKASGNPHNVTKSDVGLSNVPNVTTNDQTPTFTESTTLTKLTSGEKLSVAFGKISKSITDLINHIANKNNPHEVTKTQVGLGNVGNFKAVSTVADQGLTDTEKSNARTNIGAGTGNSNFSGSYNDLTNKPALGTAATKNVPASGNASTSEVVLGSDTRLSNARPASDVSAWAKASSKPSYTWDEITNKPTSFSPYFANTTWYLVGDDVYIGDHDQAGGLGIWGVNSNTKLDFCQYDNNSNFKSITFDGTTLYLDGNCCYASQAGNADTLYNKSNDYYGVWLGGMTILKGTEAGMSQSVAEDPLHRYIKPTSIIDIYYDDNSVQYASEIGMLYNIQESGGVYYLSIAPKKDVVKQDIVIQNILVRNP